LIYGLESYENGDAFITDTIVSSTQYIVKTLSGTFFELGDPLNSQFLKDTEKSMKNMKHADEFLNSIILITLICGVLGQTGIVPFFGNILGNEFNYYEPNAFRKEIREDYSTSSETLFSQLLEGSRKIEGEQAARGSKGGAEKSIGKDSNSESSTPSKDELDSTNTARSMQTGSDEGQAGRLQEIEDELFGTYPLSLQGLLDDDDIEDDFSGEQSNDERWHDDVLLH